MLLQEPAESPYDLRFEMFGFSIRIAWTFWLGAAFFGYNIVQGIDDIFRDASPGRLPLLLLWALCLFVSILIHELGHAFAFRACGLESKVLLYHFGGLAIPQSGFGSGRRLSPQQDFFIAAAGPAAQILSAVVLLIAFRAFGFMAESLNWMPSFIPRIPWLMEGAPIDSVGLYALGVFYVLPSILWGLLNLLPVWPLDGGRIARAMIELGGGQLVQSLWLSLIVAGLVAYWGFTSGQFFLGILFASMAINNYQVLQQYGGRF